MTGAEQIWTLLGFSQWIITFYVNFHEGVIQAFLMISPGYRVFTTEEANRFQGLPWIIWKIDSLSMFQSNERNFCITWWFIFTVKWIKTKAKNDTGNKEAVWVL